MAAIKLAHVGRFFKLILSRPEGRINSFLTLNMERDRQFSVLFYQRGVRKAIVYSNPPYRHKNALHLKTGTRLKCIWFLECMEHLRKRKYQMIVIKVTQTDGKERLFTDHHQVCNYLKDIEKQKILEPGTKKIWSFIHRRYETLYSLYYRHPSFKDF